MRWDHEGLLKHLGGAQATSKAGGVRGVGNAGDGGGDGCGSGCGSRRQEPPPRMPLLGCAELSGGPPWDTSTIFTDCLALVCI